MNPCLKGTPIEKVALRTEAFLKGDYIQISDWAIYSFTENGFLEVWHVDKNFVCTVKIVKNDSDIRLVPGQFYENDRVATEVPDHLYFDRAQALAIFERDYL